MIWCLNGQENFEQMLPGSESSKIACSVYVDGMDWYRTPCYRYFEGNKPKFLASILYKHEIKIMKDFQTSIANIKSAISLCGSCIHRHNLSCTNPSCINTPIGKVEIPKPEEFVSKKLIAKIISECENPKATNNLENVRAACASKPHLKFEIDVKSIIKCIACYNDEKEEYKTSVSNFVAWCMFDNDDCVDSKRLDGIMVRYKYFKNIHNNPERKKSYEEFEDFRGATTSDDVGSSESDDDYSEMIEV